MDNISTIHQRIHDGGVWYHLGALLEELFFRGLLYPMLRRWFGLVVAVVLTAVAFASIHGAQLGMPGRPC